MFASPLELATTMPMNVTLCNLRWREQSRPSNNIKELGSSDGCDVADVFTTHSIKMWVTWILTKINWKMTQHPGQI